MQPKHDKNRCLNNPKYLGPNPIKQESPSLPPLQVPPPKTVKKPCFPPNRQSSNSSSSSTGIRKRGQKGKKPEWKKTLTEVYPDNSRKWTKNMSKNSRISPLLLITKSNTMTPPMTISMANQAIPKIFDFQWNFKYNRGVMLRFSPYSVSLVITLTSFSYPIGLSL